MSKSAVCPDCGRKMDYDEDLQIFTCVFCGKSFGTRIWDNMMGKFKEVE